MYSGSANIHNGESEDERLARRLQQEEQHNLTVNQLTAPNNLDTSNMTTQERDDMMLARQMAQIDSYQSGINPHQHSVSNSYQQHGNDRMFAEAFGDTSASSGVPRAAEPPGAFGGGSYQPASSPYSSSNSPHNSNSHTMGNASMGGSSGGSGGSGGRRNIGEADREDRLAYARRLQEEAFSRMQANVRPAAAAPQSTEESDLELAMKMQLEEGDPSVVASRPPAAVAIAQQDDDMELARFMQESGVSISQLDEHGLANLKRQQGLGGTGAGLQGPKPPPNQSRDALSALGLGGGGGGGLYDGKMMDDESDEDESIAFEVLQGGGQTGIPAGIPSSLPAATAARPNPTPLNSGQTASAYRKPAPKPAPTQQPGIPSAIPVLAANGMPPSPSSPIPPLSSPVTVPPASQNQRRITDTARQQSMRLLESTASPTPPGRIKPYASRSGGLARMLPGASKSFGRDRSGAPVSDSKRSPPGKSKSAHNNLLGMKRGGQKSQRKIKGRSVSPVRGRGHQRNPSNDGISPMLGEDLPPGVNLADANAFGGGPDIGEEPEPQLSPTPAKKEKKKGMLKRIFGGNKHGSDSKFSGDIPSGIPAAIPGPPPGTEAGPLPHSVSVNRNIAQNALRSSTTQEKKAVSICCVCNGRNGKMLVAMDRKFHVECFRCMSCNDLIDPLSVFAVSVDPMGEQQPLHRKCYAEFYGVQCAVCRKAIPANDDGSVSFIKHPFFNTEQMCPCHADESGRRRCTGCHRFEPEDEPFADLNDGGRCVCYSCCRSVIINNEDVKPLWQEVLKFFEFVLGLPIWQEMRDIPILVVDQAALNESQMQDGTSAHSDSSQIMTRGLCLSEHEGSMHMSTSFRVPAQRFNESISAFEACNHSGFMDFDVGNLKGNSKSEVMAILCLSGLPRDLTASVLAHEATHAWIKLHPDFKIRKQLPAQVEEGCAQLVAYLFLSDGLEPSAMRASTGKGPTDEKLRQYFKFSIETDDNDIYGEGYRKAAAAYSSIGITALLNHVVHYQAFPQC